VQRLRENSFRLLVEREKRILRIAERLRVAGVEICRGKTRPVLGLIATTEHELISLNLAPGKPRREASREVEILWVEPGYPAAEAGLVPGDVVLEIEGRPVQSSAALYKHANIGAEVLHLLVKRNGELHEVDVPHLSGCFAAASVVVSTSVNAYLTRDGIYVTAGMVRVMEDDSELAVVLGHEMGHHILGTGNRADYESDADYIGLYIAARAGFDITVASGLWKRWAVRQPGILRMDDLGMSTHPRSARRALALDETIREIREKRAEGTPLSPEVPD